LVSSAVGVILSGFAYYRVSRIYDLNCQNFSHFLMSAEDSDVELFSENEEEPDLKEEPNIFSDDEEEESDLERPVKKKQKRRPGNIFIEDQARVDDTDDEDDDEEAEDGFELNGIL
jgi:hypothetical protein